MNWSSEFATGYGADSGLLSFFDCLHQLGVIVWAAFLILGMDAWCASSV